MWLRGRTELAGNVSVDAVAKVALNLAQSQTPALFSGFYRLENTQMASSASALERRSQ